MDYGIDDCPTVFYDWLKLNEEGEGMLSCSGRQVILGNAAMQRNIVSEYHQIAAAHIGVVETAHDIKGAFASAETPQVLRFYE
jgi:hypothetical protein